jgi:Tol biopolymer transport system component
MGSGCGRCEVRAFGISRWLLLAALLGADGQSVMAVDDGEAASLIPQAAASIVFTALDERSASFTADGRTVYFALRVADGYMQVLCTSTLRGSRWSEPVVLPFSGQHFDADPFITPDGNTLYFSTNRQVGGGAKADLDIWVARRRSGRWGEPRPVAGGVNSSFNERSPVLGRSGKLYFSSTRTGAGDLFYAVPVGDGWGEPVPLGDGVNSPAPELHLALSPDERTLVFAAVGRDDELLAPGEPYLRGDLYVSHLRGGVWSRAVHLGPEINTQAAELNPFISADGRTLYFMSERGFATDQSVRLDVDTLTRGLHSILNGRGNIYRVSSRILEEHQQ